VLDEVVASFLVVVAVGATLTGTTVLDDEATGVGFGLLLSRAGNSSVN
jgi:hypothetical protein